MDCSKCGLELPDDAKICTFCGEPTDSLTSRPTQPTHYQRTSVTTRRSSNNISRIIVALYIILVVGIFFNFVRQFVFRIQFSPSVEITMLIVGVIIICCIVGSVGSHRRGDSGGGGGGYDWGCCSCCCSGCDSGDCDC